MPQPPSLAATKRPGLLRRIIRIFAVSGILIFALLAGRHLFLSAKIKTQLSQIAAAKEPVTLKDLDSYYKGLPLNNDGGSIYAQAFRSVRIGGSSRFLENVTELPHDTNSLPQDLREKFQKSVTDSTNALETLRKAADLGACRFPLDYTAGWDASLAHLAMLRNCGHLEACHGVLQEQAGDLDSAIESVELISKYANSVNDEPDLVSVLVQERLNLQAYDLSVWILNHHQLSANQLATLQNIFEKAEPTNWIDRAIIGDRCTDVATFDYSPGTFLSLISNNPPQLSDALAIRFVHAIGQAKQDELAILRRLEQVRETARLPFPERLDRADQLSSDIRKEAAAQLFFVTGSLVPPLIRSINRDAEHIAYIRLMFTALALEHYRLDRGTLPPNLYDLTPKYLKTVPVDPFNGHPLRYLPSNSGYLLYSVGPDRMDEQGEKSVNLYSNEPKPEGDLTLQIHR